MKRLNFYVLLSILLITVMSNAQITRYIRPAATGDGSGSSWDNASNDLQLMINQSSSGDKIFVAAGTYVPNRKANATGTITENNTDNAFVLKAGVAVYGGFDPDNGSSILSNRRAMPGSASVSILSGDMDGDNSNNATHVVIIAGGTNYTLDGFVIQRSNASSSPNNNNTVNGQTVAKNRGGGIYITNATTVYIKNCWIRGNRGNMGAGAYTDVSPTFSNCVFSGNYTTSNNGSNSRGAGLYNSGAESLFGTLLFNCTFSGNRAGASGNGRGGAIYNTGKMLLANIIIYGNSAADGQNGIRNDGGEVYAEYCLIGDSSQTTSNNNSVGGNPQFVNAPGAGDPFITGDYKLNSNSAALNAGSNSFAINVSFLDIQGLNRPNGMVDVGAHERGASYPTMVNIIRYVKTNGTGDGSTWANASGDLQEMINYSISGDQIFVAGGTYKPNRTANNLTSITPNNRNNAFVLKNNVKIYGNFAGTEITLEQRDLSDTENRSVLSGDFNDNDIVSGSGANLNISGNGENAFHVVIAAGNLGTGTVLDGFTITGGNANGANNTITVNGEDINRTRGGGIYSRTSSPIIRNSLIRYNQASQGAGMVQYYGSPQIINCVFNKNRAIMAGSALRSIYSSGDITIINSTIFGNRDNGDNGVIFRETSAKFYNSIVYGNNSGIGGSGSVTQQNSLVQGQTSTANGNINGNTNPLFVNATAGDFRLQFLSPCANTGNNSHVPSGVTTDIAGNTRIQDCAVDMGAYESNPIPAPIAENQTSCAENTISDLIAEGENLQWYDVVEDGDPLASDTILTVGTYYVSQTINGCESPKTEINVTLYNTPVPEAESSQYFCIGATVTELQAEGENLQWYDISEGNSLLDENAALTTGTYYVSQSLNGCESPRIEINVTVYNTPAAEAETSQYVCVGTIIAELQAEGENLQWYDVVEGGSPLDENTALTTGIYYVSQSLNGCESPRTEINITVYNTPAAEAETPQYICAGATIAELQAEGENLQWYDVAEDGESLTSDIEIFEGTYYVSQTINGCESPRTAVAVMYSVEAPAAPSPQDFTFSGFMLSSLEATGENLKWYNTATGGEALDLSDIVTAGTYYVSQTIDGCESGRTAVTISIAATVRYVKSTSSGSGDGSSWTNASNDLQAMINVSSNGNYIFVAKGTYKPNRRADATGTITPNNVYNAFVLKNGVKIYGNFAGTETSLDQRDLSVTANKSVLSGDFNNNDTVSGSGSTLSLSYMNDNACHVVISVGTISSETVLDGFTITKGGNINTYANITVKGTMIPSTLGGGLFNINSSTPTISNCIFTRNYARFGGGAVYSSGGSSSEGYPTFINCIFSKNLGVALNSNSYGGAVQSSGVSRYFNCTFWGNRADIGGGIYTNSGSVTLRNSIVHGNSSGISGNSFIANSLVQGSSSTSNNNINGNTNPQFVNASGGNFRLQMTSPAINKGSNSFASATDIAGNIRIQLGTVDMGAYESDRYGTIWRTSNNWLNNVEPDVEKDVYIEGDLSVGTDYGSFEAKTLTVEGTGSVTIETGSAVTVKETIINKAQATDFVVENDGILIQVDDVENTGKIKVFRNSSPMKRLDYTLWSSPVSGMLLKDFSQVSPSGGYGTLWNRVYTLGETAWKQIWTTQEDFQNDNTTTFSEATGYLYRSRNDFPTTPIVFTGEFTGVPHNGIATIATPLTFNAIGNPYPSPVDANDFITGNEGINAIYFWTNVNAPVDGNYNLNNWAIYTTMGGTGVAVSGDIGNGVEFIPEDDMLIQPGQGFVVHVTESQVQFNNGMRRGTNENFFRQMSSERHRYWLNLSNEEVLFNQILVGYIENATQGADTGIDAKIFGYEGSAVYSLIENSEENYVIQGRELPFTDTDVVPLGFRAANAGTFSISLDSFDGIFEEGNTVIYLKDNFNQTQHNLNSGAYTFLSEEGVFDNRFEIIYQTTMSVENPEPTHTDWIIYKKDDGFQIRTNGFDMKEVQVFDMLGRTIYTSKAEGTAHHIPALGADGVYVVKVMTTENKVLSKKVK